jgi:hypothetical protein
VRRLLGRALSLAVHPLPLGRAHSRARPARSQPQRPALRAQQLRQRLILMAQAAAAAAAAAARSSEPTASRRRSSSR